MKCRAQHKARDVQAMRMFFIFAGYVLHTRFGFSDARLQDFAAEMGEFFKSEGQNDTIGDEALAWAEKHRFFAEETK